MRGRWASAALGAGMARRQASYEMDQAQAYESQLQHSQQQIEAQQTEKLKKFAELKKQGIITEEEFQKLKADLLSKM